MYYIPILIRIDTVSDIWSIFHRVDLYCFLAPQSKLSRLPAYLTVQFVRFYFKEKDAINAKILKVG